MLTEPFSEAKREVKTQNIKSDLVIVGGGMSGTCGAITAARAGLKVTLVQDRPVLGGNACSEVRLWILGATSHMSNNNRWSREEGVIGEIMVENMFRNKEGNPIILDTILLEKVTQEPNITLLLNTAVYEVEKSGPQDIDKVIAYCSQNSTKYILNAPLFCDSSGDGIVAFQAGAAFRMGAETDDEFGEGFAPSQDYGELLGHSIYFYTKDVGQPVKFVPPSYALQDISQLPRYKSFNLKVHGCALWWIEYGGRLDTVHQTEEIKWKLWEIIYGIWNYIKNSGNFPEMENSTLEWVGTIPGKRESRRFEGDYMLKQQDVVNQKTFYDAVAHGGWSLDLHPADGVFTEKPGCNQWHAKGVYQIPYRCYVSHNINNLFLSGRIISASHVAFGSSRVMATCSVGSQAVATAAVLCKKHGLRPRDIEQEQYIGELQRELMRSGQFIPGRRLKDDEDLVQKASISASSERLLEELPFDGPWEQLDYPAAQLLPLEKGKPPEFEISVWADEETTLKVNLKASEKPFNYTPDVDLEEESYPLQKGHNKVEIAFNAEIPAEQYIFLCLSKNDQVFVRCSSKRLSGILSVFNRFNPEVSNYGKQTPPEDIGMDEFELWCPQRRPKGHNLGMKIKPGIKKFNVENIRNGYYRPTKRPNAWVADFHDKRPWLMLDWETPQEIKKIVMAFDTDFDHAMESTLRGHPEDIMPFTVRNYKICDENDNLIYHGQNNHQTRNEIVFDNPVKTKRLIIEVDHPLDHVPASVFGVRCYNLK